LSLVTSAATREDVFERADRSERLPAAHLQTLRLADDLHPELLRLVELGTGFFARQNVIRFLAHAAADLAAQRFNLRRGLFAFQCRQRAGQHKCFTGKNPKLAA
jgi:hypothetical protein